MMGTGRHGFWRLPLLVRMLVYTVGFLGMVLIALPWAFHRIDIYLPAIRAEVGPFRILGATLTTVSLALYLGASYVLTHRGKGAYVEFDPPTRLVIVGPYRYTRNPVAATLIATVLGEAIWFSSTGILLMFCAFVVLARLQVTRIEEPLLHRRYGRAYDDYCASVPRWIPRLRPRGRPASA